MNPETILLILRLMNISLGILTEIETLIKRVQAGEIITDAEIEEGSKRVEEAIARLNAAKKKAETEP